MKSSVLIISKDELPTFELAKKLESNGFTTEVVSDGLTALNVAESLLPNHAIIDLSMGKEVSLELAEMIRNLNGMSKVKVSFLLSSVDEHSKSERFGYLADEYFIKNGNLNHIVTKLKRLNSMNAELIPPVLTDLTTYNNLHIDREAYSVRIGEREITFSKKEFELLELLTTKPQKVFTRTEIFQNIWKRKEIAGADRTLDVHIRRLRKKLGTEYIKTVKGVGYRLAVN